MHTAHSAMHIIQPATSTHAASEKDRLIGKPRFHFEPREVMQLLRTRIIG